MNTDDTWKRVRTNLVQEPYANGGGLSKRDWVKLVAAWVLLVGGAWLWHDVFGKDLPSDEVVEFAKHAAYGFGITGAVGIGMRHARRRKP